MEVKNVLFVISHETSEILVSDKVPVIVQVRIMHVFGSCIGVLQIYRVGQEIEFFVCEIVLLQRISEIVIIYSVDPLGFIDSKGVVNRTYFNSKFL